MENADAVVAVFGDHNAAERAVTRLAAAGFEISTLSVVGKGFHTEEKIVGLYNAGDRIKFWGARGGLSGLFSDGVFMIIPGIGHIVVLGHLAATVAAAVESALTVGGLSALGAALYSIGMPKNSVLQYEAAVTANDLLVMAHGPMAEVARAEAILRTANPARIDMHAAVQATAPADHRASSRAGRVQPKRPLRDASRSASISG